MPEKLDRRSWAAAVKKHRGDQVSSKAFASQVKRAKAPKPQNLSGLGWKERIKLAKTGGPHYRAIGQPRGQRKGRPVGGMLRNTIPRRRKEISENQRQALPKTGNQTPKKGINASSWAYDHQKTIAARRERALAARQSGPKHGINAEKWHYDHTKSRRAKSANQKGPTTHVSTEKKRTQREAIAQYQPKQPTRPKPSPAKVKPKVPIKARGK